MSKGISIRKRIALELARSIRNNRKQIHELKQLFWECTQRCNVNCKHCGSDCKHESGVPDMPAKDFLNVIDSITPHVNPNKVNVIITGGEPLVRNDLEYVGLELYNRGYSWGIVSNGLFLSPQRLERLLASGMHAITISLDGFEQEHNWLRGNPKSFEKAVQAVKLISQEPSIKWDIVTCVNQKNYPYLEDFKNFIYSIGVRQWRLFTIFPVGRAVNHPEFKLTDEEFTGLLDFIKRTREEGSINVSYGCEGFLGRYEGEVRNNFYTCNAGISVSSILADGSIGACPSIRADFSQGNIYTDNFWDVWENRYQKFRNREWLRQGECADCKLFRYCEGNGMHLHDSEGKLMFCHFKHIK